MYMKGIMFLNEAQLEAYFVLAFETKLILRLVEAVSNPH